MELMHLADEREEPEDVIIRLARALVEEAIAAGWSGPPFDPTVLASLRGISVKPADCDIRSDARIFPLPMGKLQIEYDPSKPQSSVVSHK
jgi:hypothetical protein